jgi:hypothetical protein
MSGRPAELRKRFVEVLVERKDPLVSRVNYPWWVGILGFLPQEDAPCVIGTCDDRSISRITATLRPLLGSRARLPRKVAERLELLAPATVGAAAVLMTRVLEEEARAWVEGREPDYSPFPRALYAPGGDRA